MSNFQYVTYITKLRKLILLNFVNFTSLGSFIHLIKESAFNRHEIIIFPKENISVVNISVVIKRLCEYACIFSFKNGKYLSFKTTSHCLLFFLIDM